MSKKDENENRGLKSLKETLVKIFALSKPYRKRFYFATIVVLIGSAIWLTVPLGLRELLDAVFEEGNAGLLNILAIGLMVLFIVQAVFTFLGNYHLEWVGERVVTDLRKKVYEHLHRLGFRFFAERRLGEITSRLTNDVGSIRTALTDSLPQLLTITFSMDWLCFTNGGSKLEIECCYFHNSTIVTIATRYFGQKYQKIIQRYSGRTC